MTAFGGSNSPAIQRFAVRSSFPAMSASSLAVLVGQQYLANATQFGGGTILSLPCAKCHCARNLMNHCAETWNVLFRRPDVGAEFGR
jgi:hypothetical protein